MTGSHALDDAQRGQLERIVIACRRLLEADMQSAAEGRFGIHLDGRIEGDDALHLDATASAQRRELVEIVAHLRSLGGTGAGAVARLTREATFTHLNRLVAIRLAETIGLLPESLALGKQSAGFRQVAELAPLISNDYSGYLKLCGDELAADAPALFDPRNPLLALAPSPACLDKVVDCFADPTTAGIWEATDALGWAYQFFNTGEERRAMRDASVAPRDSRELAVRNQFFTPRYVVDFLVQNTLGRRLVEASMATPLPDDLPLLLDAPTIERPLRLDEVKILDPACGSGHFLLGCYDVLERAWAAQGVDPADSAPRIVSALHGVDIDLRCAQIASAAIMLRARRHCRHAPLPKPMIVTARGLPPGATLPDDVAPDLRRLVKKLTEVLRDVPVLGVLLTAERALQSELRGMVFGSTPGTLQLTDQAYRATEPALLDALQRQADSTAASAGDRLFAAEAADAVRLIEICRTRFDVVLMNPPFGEPVPETKPYLRSAYPWLPTKDSNLLAAFVGRGLELCKPDGYLGAITSRAGMFLSTFLEWRRRVLLGNRLTVLADLGSGVMEQALVEAAAYVIAPGDPGSTHAATFVRLLKETDRPAALASAIGRATQQEHDERVFRVPLSDFLSVPGSPLAYWMTPSVRRFFKAFPPLEGNGAEVRVGMQTGDDFRFVRAFWEVDPRRIARSRQETRAGKRWVPFAKGGDYSRFWADIHLIVDWKNDGDEVGKFPGAVLRNTTYYFRPGLTWPVRTNSGFGARVLPAGSIFSHKGSAILPTSTGVYSCLGVLTSRLYQALIDSMVAAGDEVGGGASRSYEVGLVQRLPSPRGISGLDDVGTATEKVVKSAAMRDRFDETSRRFVAPRLPSGASVLAGALAEQQALDIDNIGVLETTLSVERLLHKAVGLDAAGLEYLDEEIGPHPAAYPMEAVDAPERLARLYSTPMDQLIHEVIHEKGGSRAVANLTYFADRRLEVLAHALKRHPSAIVALAQERTLLPPGFLLRYAQDIMSYLFGSAVGRWDVRVGRDPATTPTPPGLLEPVPVCPPGMLVARDGLPVVDAPAEYPLALPPARMLVDQPGHPWDVEAAVARAADAVLAEPDRVIAETLQILGRESLRDYIRRDFFNEYLSRYSKSRRRAPIYWPLRTKGNGWAVWIYAPVISRETLYAVAHEARQRERLALDAIDRLGDEKTRGPVGRTARKLSEQLDAEVRLSEDLRRFRTNAERVAEMGWEPDLDDGLVLNAAPLASLIPDWPEAAEERKRLKAGKYPWAKASRWTDQM